jgi:hypothetical protein
MKVKDFIKTPIGLINAAIKRDKKLRKQYKTTVSFSFDPSHGVVFGGGLTIFYS